MNFCHKILFRVLLSVFIFLPSGRAQSVRFSFPKDLEAQEFARDPMLKNPVGLSVGFDGTVYVTETQRRKAQNLDIRSNSDWINTELSFQTVASKKAFYKRTLSRENSDKNKRRISDHNKDGYHDWRDLMVLSEFVHAIKDRDGDGIADEAKVFAGDFKTSVSGVAGGVFSWGDDVYVNVAPHVWKLRDTDNDGVSDWRQPLAYGFANHIAYGGHNTHGVTVGLDGRIYWSIGDTSSDYTPHEGAVFRCEPDGTKFEVFARGLRNPQEIVFDDYGNMFTGDNDADFGDRERWYYLVEDGDYGWRFWWQYQRGRNWAAPDSNYSVWMEEKLWHERFDGQSAYIIPAIKLIDNGPCGMAAYPGIGMPERFKNSFLLAHFTGSPSNSGIRQYKVDSKGADFNLTDDSKIISGAVITGVDFAPDGSGLFFADWSGSWPLNTQGKVFKVSHPQLSASDVVMQSRKLLNGGLDSLNPDKLKVFLAHENRNVRREAQFKLARSGRGGRKALMDVLESSQSQIARVHAIWGVDMIGRKNKSALRPMVRFLKDKDSEIRSQVAKSFGDNRYFDATDELRQLLSDEKESSRTRYMAAVALGKIGDKKSLDHVLSMLEKNKSSDLMLRHAGIFFLKGLKDYRVIAELSDHPSEHVRLAAVVALRKMENPHVARFLGDDNQLVVLEAARAINDVPLEPARSHLASLIHPSMTNEALYRRVLNAHFRIGKPENLGALISYAAASGAPEKGRVEALRILNHWTTVSPRDRVCGAWFTLGYNSVPGSKRSNRDLKRLLTEKLPSLLDSSDMVALETISLVERLDIEVHPKKLSEWILDDNKSSILRLSGLNLLAKVGGAELSKAVNGVLSDEDPELRSRALVLLSKNNRSEAEKILSKILRGSSIRQKQTVIRALPELNSKFSKNSISELAKKMNEGELDSQILLDTYRALERAKNPSLTKIVSSLTSGSPEKISMNLYSVLGESGGSPELGRKVFEEKVELACLRCHQIPEKSNSKSFVGGTMGPNLAGIGDKKMGGEIAEAILYPNKTFAEGFEMVSITLLDDSIKYGRVIEKNDSYWIIEEPVVDTSGIESEFELDETQSAEPVRHQLSHESIKRVDKGISAMPPGLHSLMTMEEFRDLVAFLKSI